MPATDNRMKLIHCPGCRNQIGDDSEICPVCGCNPRRRRITRVVKWSVVLLCCGWAAEHFISRELAAHHSSARHVDSRHT
jgi:hypothetical protein